MSGNAPSQFTSWLMLCFFSLFLIGIAGSGQTALALDVSDSSLGPSLRRINREDLEAFLTTTLSLQLQSEHIAGAAVAVVHEGKLLTAKGFGYANLERQQAVVAGQTAFLTGSTGKLFTWTAVMQLVEQGKLDLDADINTYLDFKIPATYPVAITLKHLMSHSAGFEDRAFLFARDPGDLRPLGPYLASHLPKRVRPAGELSGYSNYGAALAGYLVERVSHQPFADYISEHLFIPLQMHHSSFSQPLSPLLQADLTASYAFEQGVFRQLAPKYIRLPPAGSSVTTVTDMAQFMIAHLNLGRYGTTHILSEATARRMQGRLWSQDPRVNGFAYGFAESTVNGQRLLRHEGEVPGNGCSALMLLPEQGLGLYVAYNGMCDMNTGTRLWDALLDQYYPEPAQGPIQAITKPIEPTALVGTYRSTRRSETSFSKAMLMLGAGDITVSISPAGDLQTEGLGPQPLFWTQTQAGVFRPANGTDTIYGRLVFRSATDGLGQVMLIENIPYRAYEQIKCYQTSGFNLSLLAACLIVFFTTLVIRLSSWLIKRTQRPVLRATTTLHWARGLMGLASALYLIFVLGLIILAADALMYGVTPMFRAILTLPIIATLLVPASLMFAVRSWHDPAWGGLFGRLPYAGVILATAVMTGWLWQWNLLGYWF